MSVIFGIGGLATEYIYTSDWWRPLTITHTRVGIEDFLFGFWIAGIASVIYEELFKKRMYVKKSKKSISSFVALFSLLAIMAMLFYGSFYLLKLSSFYATVVTFVPSVIFLWIKRKDLIVDSVMSGFLTAFVGLLWYWIAEYFTPGWIQHYWLFQNISGILVLKAPLEDFIWIFLFGTFIGPLYEVCIHAKLVPYFLNKSSRR